MTTDSSRKSHISREKKAQAKGERRHELEPNAEGPGLREWFYRLPQAKKWGHAAAFDTRLGSALAGGAGSEIARMLRGHDYELVKNPGIWSGPHCRWVAWGAQLVRTSVAHPEGWATWHKLSSGNE